MEIIDKVYGTTQITEPVLLKLINSKPIQRLKKINQAGASQYAFEGKTVSRFDHSVGVMILLAKLGANTEEQIAGLLHDVPHTAFSHVIDFVFKTHQQDFHEQFHEKIIINSEIPSILDEFGFETNRIIDENNFPLLEKSLPDLCADRIDYTLRDMVATYGFSDKINDYISSFVVNNNEIILSNNNTAEKLTQDYLNMDKTDWSHPLGVTLFQILADAITIALNENIITQNDLFQDDEFVYSKLKNSNNSSILKKLSMLNPNLKITLNPDDYDFFTKTKLRYIDPKFLNLYDSVSCVSEQFPELKQKITEHKKQVNKGYFIKIVSF